jgi:N-acetylglucosaminyldiphosphoundecaprenol N-acetyl-beta-D-mannosaminyltransferase
MRNTIKILDVPIDDLVMDEAVKKIGSFLNEEKVHTVFTPNPEILMLANQNRDFKEVLVKADLVVPDGIGVVIASRILKTKSLKERVAGYDLVQNTMKEGVKRGYRYYFLGAKPGVAKKAAENMRVEHPGIEIVGIRDGYFKEEEIPSIIEEINESKANILLVALGAPRQEAFIEKYKGQFSTVRVAIGVGGSLDGMAGIVKRAPKIYQNLGLEWFYRLVRQPTRFKRMLILPQFLLKILLERI